MFGNFIQFIVVILIYATYQPVEETNFSLVESILLFFCLAIIFAGQTWISFHRLEKRIALDPPGRLDHRFDAIVFRQSMLAIGLFIIDIYGLNLTSFLATLPLFAEMPTIQALFCLCLFIGYLSIVWSFAHATSQQIYPTRISRGAYVRSNITFSVPILLPWLVLSGLADLLLLLPFESTQWILSTTTGHIIYMLTFLFAIALAGPALIQKFWRCKPMENGAIRSQIESLCRRADMTYNNILYWPIFGGRMITAGIMGLITRFRYILVTNALLRYLSPAELDAVIAHEIGHVKKKHLLFYLMFFTGFMLLSYAVPNVFFYSLILFGPVIRMLVDAGISPGTIKSALYALGFIVVFLIYFRFIFGFFMRNFERQADAYVYTLFESAAPLVSTLQKIAIASGQPADKPNWHHFSIGERIRFLQKCEDDRRWIRRHDQKIKVGIALYLAGMILFSVAGYQLNYGESGQSFFRHQIIRYLQEELASAPQKHLIYGTLGDLHYEEGNFEETISAYENALALKPESPHVLNNLAWLYATCADTKFRNPERALFLAKEAARLDRSPQILDTLAESYYINGNIDAAIEAGALALRLAERENRAYFKEQLEKFKGIPEKSGDGESNR